MIRCPGNLLDGVHVRCWPAESQSVQLWINGKTIIAILNTRKKIYIAEHTLELVWERLESEGMNWVRYRRMDPSTRQRDVSFWRRQYSQLQLRIAYSECTYWSRPLLAWLKPWLSPVLSFGERKKRRDYCCCRKTDWKRRRNASAEAEGIDSNWQVSVGND